LLQKPEGIRISCELGRFGLALGVELYT